MSSTASFYLSMYKVIFSYLWNNRYGRQYCMIMLGSFLLTIVWLAYGLCTSQPFWYWAAFIGVSIALCPVFYYLLFRTNWGKNVMEVGIDAGYHAAKTMFD